MPPKPPLIAAAMNLKLKTLLTAFSLFLIATLPITLTITTISKFSSNAAYESHPKPSWFPFPSLATIHFADATSTVLMSVAAGLVCVNGAFFNSDSDALPLYLLQIIFSFFWNPFMLRVGDADIALIFCAANFMAVLSCYFVFGEACSSSKVFVMPCLVWAGFLLFLTFLLAPRDLFFVEDDLNEILLWSAGF